MNERGSTSVLEVLCVAIILALLSVILVPKLSLLEKSSLDYETTYLVSDLRWLQEVSQNRKNKNTRFSQIDGEAQPTLNIGKGKYYIIQGGKVIKKHILTKDIWMSYNREEIGFDFDGETLPLTIEVHQGKICRAVIVDRVGRIRVEKRTL
ncbi:MAG: hypothetical protein WCS30_12385 [Selenomonadaceae bacterium]